MAYFLTAGSFTAENRIITVKTKHKSAVQNVASVCFQIIKY